MASNGRIFSSDSLIASGGSIAFGDAGPSPFKGDIFTLSQLEDTIHSGSFSMEVTHIKAAIKSHIISTETGSYFAGIDILRKKSWVGAPPKLFTRDSFDLLANLVAKPKADLLATLNPFHEFDLLAALDAVIPEDLPADLQPVPPKDLPTDLFAIASVNLGAIGGGHFPEDITASTCGIPPVDIPVFIRGGFSDIKDLGATLIQTGGFEGIDGFIKIFQRDFKDLPGRITARVPQNLTAFIQGLGQLDLPASLVTQREGPPLRAILKGFSREAVSDISAFIRRTASDSKDLPVVPFKARVSTHTSDKIFNIDKVLKIFPNNIYAFGSKKAGFYVLTIEPVFGNFPDLHAEIFAQPFFRKNITAFVRVAQRDSFDLRAQVVAVTAYVNINKLVLSLVPLLDLGAELTPKGGFLGLRTIIKPRTSTSTQTDKNAGFVTTASSYKFYIGTTKGLFIPPQVVPTLRVNTFVNNHVTPDLHAYIAGWNEANLGASISDYPFIPLSASLTATDLDHIKALTASLFPAHPANLEASLSPVGGFIGLSASLASAGLIDDFGATITANISPISLDIITVSTKPFSDLSAIINYETVVSCFPASTFSNIAAYIKPLISGTLDNIKNLSAEIVASRLVSDLGAEIFGCKRIRIRILSLNFRSKTRASESIRGSITPVVVSQLLNLTADIKGLSHEFDLPASLTTVRLPFTKADLTKFENVVNLQNALDVKQVLISFRSQTSFYVYEEAINKVFSTDQGTWVLDIRSLRRDEAFFDRSESNREITVSDIQEFFSLDEAIRNAIVLLCERRQAKLGASLTARGAINDLNATAGVVSADRMLNLPTSLVAVANSPDITAQINIGPQSSAFLHLFGIVVPENSEVSDNIGGSIVPNMVENIGASITATL